MFLVQVKKNLIDVRQTEPMTSGSQNVYVMSFRFSDEWDTLKRTAVFRAIDTATVDEENPTWTVYNILLDDTNECMIPWEVMTKARKLVQFGVFGTRGGNVVLPTVWAEAGTMLQGVTTGVDIQPPTPGVYQQILAKLQEMEDKLLNGVTVEFGLPVMKDQAINSAAFFDDITFPSAIVLENCSIQAANTTRGVGDPDRKTLTFHQDVAYFEKVPYDDPANPMAIRVTDMSGSIYLFPYDPESAYQYFTDMVIVPMSKGAGEPLVYLTTFSIATIPAEKDIISFDTTLFNREPQEGEFFILPATFHDEKDNPHSYLLTIKMVSADDVSSVGEIVTFFETGSGGGINFTIDDTLTLSDEDVLSVSLPTKHISADEYEALPEEEKMKDVLYVIPETDNTGATVPSTRYSFGHGFNISADNVVSIATSRDFEGDNTLPPTTALLQNVVGNVEALLKTI